MTNLVKSINVSIHELICIEHTIESQRDGLDSIDNLYILTGEQVHNDTLCNLALKVGKLIVEHNNNVKDLILYLTELQCWYLREMIDIFSRIGRNEPSEGYSIKSKIYQLLLEFETEKYFPVVAQEMSSTTPDIDVNINITKKKSAGVRRKRKVVNNNADPNTR